MTEFFKHQLMDFLETLEIQLQPINEDNPDLYFLPPWIKDELKRIIGMAREEQIEE